MPSVCSTSSARIRILESWESSPKRQEARRTSRALHQKSWTFANR